MLTSLETIPKDRTLSYDLCIIGTGPAGITLATELADSGMRICMLESGGLQKTARGNELRRVVSTGISIKEHSRERAVGGTSTTWSGLSSALDPVDLGPRSYVAASGWPLLYEELRSYWEVAALRYRFPAHPLFRAFKNLRNRGKLQPRWENISEKVFLAPAEPPRFGTEWKGTFQRENVDVVCHATVTKLCGATGRVDYAVVVSDTKEQYRIHAKVFVLAAGGIENSRLLLASGMGNEHDQVGRYFMNHLKNNYGIITLHTPLGDCPYYFGCLSDGFAGYAGLRLSEDVQRSRGVLNSYVRLEPLFPWSGNDGVASAVFLFKQMESVFRAWKKNQSGKVVSLRDYAETGDDTPLQESSPGRATAKAVFSVIAHMSSVARYMYARLVSKESPLIRSIRVRNFMEMEPCAENRVILGETRDVYGQLVPRVHHVPSALDRQSLIELHHTLDKEIRAQGIGVLDSKLDSVLPWPINQDSSHHLGGTRMGVDPMTSVVDPNLRVHTVDNLYCAGGSVFPTSGCANPTFTICALSIRLAEHLRKQ